MPRESYDIGDVLRTRGAYTDINDAPIDPSAVYVSVKTPAGIVTTYTYGSGPDIQRSDVGDYFYDLTFTAPGRWYVRHYSTGIGESSEETMYFVRKSQFA